MRFDKLLIPSLAPLIYLFGWFGVKVESGNMSGRKIISEPVDLIIIVAELLFYLYIVFDRRNMPPWLKATMVSFAGLYASYDMAIRITKYFSTIKLDLLLKLVLIDVVPLYLLLIFTFLPEVKNLIFNRKPR